MTSQQLTSLARASKGVGLGGHQGDAPPRPRRRRRRGLVTLLVMVLPSVVLLVVINGYPLVFAAIQALTNGNLVQVGKFIGLQNFVAAVTLPGFWPAVRFTIIFTIVGVFGSWIIGLGLALLTKTRVHARGVIRTLLLLPWIVPIVVSSTSWNWLVATSTSPIPLLLKSLGFGNVLFLADPTLAQITVLAFKVWVSFPFMLLMMGSALAGVDENVYEAARVDGASRSQTFFRITLPLIARPTYISWILMVIFCINDFPIVYLLTGGGPIGSTNTLVVLAYQEVFSNFQTGPGVAIAFIMTIVAVIVSLVLFRQIRKADIE
ncbi:carbohydrate ABC transporter permease [Gryllotalpicola reticulitermitis]|uniref:Carbohydrate ABC transporter permease n=1 Tax=Gryllotalpicola reticulitermitis TaxID=1184153 RepID=A0ABV8Q4C4_9MICO